VSIQIRGKSKNKGFTLIEVLVSISVFCILCFAVLNLNISNIKIREKSNGFKEANKFFEEIHGLSLYECEYDEFLKFINKEEYNDKKKWFYINKEELNIENIFNKKVQVLSEDFKGSYPYIKVKFEKENKLSEAQCIKIYCTYYYRQNKKIDYEFLRGKLNEKRIYTYRSVDFCNLGFVKYNNG